MSSFFNPTLVMKLVAKKAVLARDKSRHICHAPVEMHRKNLEPRFDFLRLFCLIAVLIFQPIFANASCRFISISNISFANYNVFSALPNTGGIGSLSLKCDDEKHTFYEVALSTGQSNNYATRFMKSGVNKLNYNLYTNASRTVVWGNGTGGSGILKLGEHNTLLAIYGLIPGGQDAATGLYTDSIIASVDF